ncbi:MAG: PEP-CTERM sorting domain-containing protein [Leptolyngbyaceae cyanobacterium bins.349]|nr:PEP-CTERM sorting domain-containing protein [Leptolyngbyaceae cyanobacterium bins.349]
MANPALKSLIGAFAGATALSLGSTSVVEAAVLNFAFEVSINQGPYAGVHKGSFQFDSARLGPCVITTDPNALCATPKDSNLSLIFNLMGTTYTHADDVDYQGVAADFPAVYYYPGLENTGTVPYALSYIVMPPKTNISFAVFDVRFFMGFPDVGQVATNPALGTVTYTRILSPAPPPLPPPPLPPAPLPPAPPDPSPCELDPASCYVEAAPEPSEIGGTVLAAGLLGLFWRSRRRKSNPIG